MSAVTMVDWFSGTETELWSMLRESSLTSCWLWLRSDRNSEYSSSSLGEWAKAEINPLKKYHDPYFIPVIWNIVCWATGYNPHKSKCFVQAAEKVLHLLLQSNCAMPIPLAAASTSLPFLYFQVHYYSRPLYKETMGGIECKQGCVQGYTVLCNNSWNGNS